MEVRQTQLYFRAFVAVYCNCSKSSLFVKTSNELNVANGPNASGRELCAFPTSSPLQGEGLCRNDESFCEDTSLLIIMIKLKFK